MGVDEEGTLAHLKAHRKGLVDPTIAEHRGRIVKTTGDGMLVEFASAVDAARCAVEVQRRMVEQNIDVPQGQGSNFASAFTSATSSSTTTTSLATASTLRRGWRGLRSQAASASPTTPTGKSGARSRLSSTTWAAGTEEHRPSQCALGG